VIRGHVRLGATVFTLTGRIEPGIPNSLILSETAIPGAPRP
jgi:hypothetical protein